MSFLSHLSSKGILLAAALSIPLAATAQPKLTSIEYQSGETVINGSSFGGAPRVVMFDNFEKGDKFAKQLASISNNWSGSALLKKESDGNNAHRAVDDSGRMSQIVSTFNGDYRAAFVAFSVKVPKGTTFPTADAPKTFPSASAWKFSWLMSTSSGHSNPSLFDVCLPQYSGGGAMSMNGNTGMLGWLEKPVNWWAWDQYNHMSSYVRIDPLLLGISPIEYQFSVINNLKTYETSGLAPLSSFSKTNNSFDRVNIPGWFRKGDNDNFQALYDNVYVAIGDNALARVVISDSEIYAQSSFAIPVMAKSWSQNRIVLDNDVIPQDQSYYVHIFDSKGKRSSQALKICPKCPKMITN